MDSNRVAIRRLDPIADEALLRTTYEWYEAGPTWRHDTVRAFNTDDTLATWLYNAHEPSRCDIGVWADDAFIADIILTERAPRVVEVHFEASPKADVAALLTAFELVRDAAWRNGIMEAYTMTPIFNRTILALDKAIGFVDYGVRMFKGVTHNRAIQWVKLVIRNPEAA